MGCHIWHTFFDGGPVIICIFGGIGSGKTLTAVKTIVQSGDYCLTNFKLKHIKHHRIKYSDIIIKGEKKEDWHVNWEFWDNIRKNNKNFSIYIDEIHNIIHSRNSMSKSNILMSKWVSQIRKILQDNPNQHLYIISQSIRKIDVDFRELASVFIRCYKMETKKGNYIFVNEYFSSLEAVEYGRPFLRTSFKGSTYYKYYDTTEMIKFGDAEEYI